MLPRHALSVAQPSDSATPSTCDAPRSDVPANVPRLLDVQAAAQYLSVSVWTIRDLETAGELKRVRLPLLSLGLHGGADER